jgi:hypothetical protein
MRAGEPCDLGHLCHWAIGGQGGLCGYGSCTCSQGFFFVAFGADFPNKGNPLI